MSKRFRFLLILAVLAVSGLFLYPTVSWYFYTSKSDKDLAAQSREQIRTYAKGESLKQLDQLKDLITKTPEAALPAQFAFLKPIAAQAMHDANLAEPANWTVADLKKGFKSPQGLQDALENEARDRVLRLKEMKSHILQLGLDLSGGMSIVLEADLDAYTKKQLEKDPKFVLTEQNSEEAIGRAMEVLTSRIDQFGVSEPQLKREKGGKKIYIDIPGEYDKEKVNTFLSGKGSLYFQIVDDNATQQINAWAKANPDKINQTDFQLLVPAPADIVPAGLKVLRFFNKDQYGLDKFKQYMVVFDDAAKQLDGIHINSAEVNRDPVTNQPVINFVMDQEGGERFRVITKENKGKTMAVVLDEKVKAGARIAEEIPNGQVRMSGFDQKESADLSKTLRTGALEVNLDVKSQQAVGATLGQDAITSGINASYLGFLLVAVFMLLYYKGAGINANVALIINVIIIAAVMSVFNLTITLASIASLLLTVGISVDANVIIFERIKEEYWQGKTPSTSVKTGFEKAFWTIMDSHVTALIAAFFLSMMSNGPVKGFAITLAVGLITSMFTALFVSRLIFDFRIEALKSKRISITWRKM